MADSCMSYHQMRQNLVESLDLDHDAEGDEPAPPVTAAGVSNSQEKLVLGQLEELIRALLSSPPPSVPNSDPEWARLFAWCHKHRDFLARRTRKLRRESAQALGVDAWLLELASPPKGDWEGVRYGVMSFIRLVGMLPRAKGEAMFTGFTWTGQTRVRHLAGILEEFQVVANPEEG